MTVDSVMGVTGRFGMPLRPSSSREKLMGTAGDGNRLLNYDELPKKETELS